MQSIKAVAHVAIAVLSFFLSSIGHGSAIRNKLQYSFAAIDAQHNRWTRQNNNNNVPTTTVNTYGIKYIFTRLRFRVRNDNY